MGLFAFQVLMAYGLLFIRDSQNEYFEYVRSTPQLQPYLHDTRPLLTHVRREI